MPGYCISCHRPRTVRVVTPRPGALGLGICDECEAKGDPRFCPYCGADIDGNDPHGPGCPGDKTSG